jgi:hypothetical protein
MIAIDMEMPSCCFGNNPCPLADGETGTCKKLKFQEDCDTTEKRPSNCPLVEIQERKVSKWIGEKGYPICEKCGCNVYEKYISCSDYAEITTKMDYCPNQTSFSHL